MYTQQKPTPAPTPMDINIDTLPKIFGEGWRQNIISNGQRYPISSIGYITRVLQITCNKIQNKYNTKNIRIDIITIAGYIQENNNPDKDDVYIVFHGYDMNKNGSDIWELFCYYSDYHFISKIKYYVSMITDKAKTNDVYINDIDSVLYSSNKTQKQTKYKKHY